MPSLATLSPVDRLAEKLYPGARTGGPSPVDGTVAFYSAVLARLPNNATLLDFGAGRGAAFVDTHTRAVRELLRLSPKVARRIGVDVDPVVRENAALDEAHVLQRENLFRIPLPPASFDAVLADWVLEHLPDPLASLCECRRVLKVGGLFAARTPNVKHYSYLLSRTVGSTPLGTALLRIAQPNRRSKDIHPAYYHANTERRVRTLLRKAGFRQVDTWTHEPEPAYLMFSRATLLVGWAYERIARHGLLPRASLFVFAIA